MSWPLWRQLLAESDYLYTATNAFTSEPGRPKPLTYDQLAPLIGSLMMPEHRAILKALLLDLLADDLAELVASAVEEVAQ